MLTWQKGILFVLLIAQNLAEQVHEQRAEIPDFPSLDKLAKGFFQTKVELTDVYQGASAFAEEYYNGLEGYGRLDVLVFGDKRSIFYYDETKEILEVQGLSCKVSSFDQSIYFKENAFYGWLHHDPLIIGPSAILKFGKEKDAVWSQDPTIIRGIFCDKYSVSVQDEKNNLTIDYYFAATTWVTPYQMDDLRVPIRVEVNGRSSVMSGNKIDMKEINQLIDFFLFRPSIGSWRIFQPPLGVGCPGRKSTMSVPKLPKSFSFSAEFYDLLKGENSAESYINFNRIWFDSENKLVRNDSYTKDGKVSEMHDFNTGTIYRITNDQTCKRLPLHFVLYEINDGTLVARMKTSEEYFGISNKASYMGQRRVRGIASDIFETVTQNVFNPEGIFEKYVVTAHFSTEYVVSSVDGESVSQGPVYIINTGYNEKNSVISKTQLNILAFDDLVPYSIYQSFGIEQCFTKPEERIYFVIMFPANITTAAAIEGVDPYFLEELTFAIMEVTGVAQLRLPYLKAEYESEGIYATGLMLGTVPALGEFWLEDVDDAMGSEDQKLVSSVTDTGEKCAAACLDEKTFTCKGFHYCGLQCYLDRKDPSERLPSLGSIGRCQIYVRSVINSVPTVRLPEAVKNLQDSVDQGKFIFGIEDQKKIPYDLAAVEVVFSEGPFGKDETEKEYTIAFRGFELFSQMESEVTVEYPGVTSESECYQKCKQTTSMACSSFSYCASASNKGCRISSVLIQGTKKDYDDITPNTLCNIYSRKYLDFFDAYPGKVLMVDGDKEITSVSSAEECAKSCQTEDKFVCLGFDYCRKRKNCMLHSKHMIDLADKIVSSDVQCIHYSAKYSADYLDMGHTIVVVDDDNSKSSEISLEKCASMCSRQAEFQCKSFNYCPPSDENSVDSSCALSRYALGEPGAKLDVDKKCHHYEPKKNVEIVPVAEQKSSISSEGYTSGGLAGLIIGMLIFGIVLGAIGFVLYSYCRSKSSGEGMSVRFMKQSNA